MRARLAWLVGLAWGCAPGAPPEGPSSDPAADPGGARLEASALPAAQAASEPAGHAVPKDVTVAPDQAPPPASIAYPTGGIETISESCQQPTAVVTTAPLSVGWDYDWIWTRQALYANPQFRVVEWPGKPEKPMDVRMDVYEMADGFALVGACFDGATCNQLAAMYKRTVPSCAPVLYCGAPPLAGPPRRSNIIPSDGRWLPEAAADTTGKCARIGTCMFMQKPFVQGNPGLDCQARPTRFNLACAVEPSCEAVVACLERP